MEPREKGFRQINGANLYFETFGASKKEALFILHGGMGLDSSYLKVPGILDLVESGTQIILYDQRGNGRSDDVEYETLNREMWMSDLKEFANELSLEKYSVMGHSYGGWIALEYAATRPSELEALVLVSAHAGPVDFSKIPIHKDNKELVTYGRKVWKDSFFGPNKHWDLYDTVKPSFRAYQAAYHGKDTEYDMTEELCKIAAKTLLIVGEGEHWLREQNEMMNEKIPDSTLKVIKNAKHYSFVENPGEFTKTVREFLSL